jgi:hypothetical protein
LLTGSGVTAFVPAVPPESFLVDEHNHLLSGEAERAKKWGASLAASALARSGVDA